LWKRESELRAAFGGKEAYFSNPGGISKQAGNRDALKHTGDTAGVWLRLQKVSEPVFRKGGELNVSSETEQEHAGWRESKAAMNYLVI